MNAAITAAFGGMMPDEWIIGDSEDIEACDECTSLETLARYCSLCDEHGAGAVAAMVSYCGGLGQLEYCQQSFEEGRYSGVCGSKKDWGMDEKWDEIAAAIGSELAYFFDFERWAEEQETSGVRFVRHEGELHVLDFSW